MGIPIYSFRYLWGGPRMVGTMAQDLLAIRPDAVIHSASGYYMVDYDKLDIRMGPASKRRKPAAARTAGVSRRRAGEAVSRAPFAMGHQV
jgi:hypothetical protein